MDFRGQGNVCPLFHFMEENMMVKKLDYDDERYIQIVFLIWKMIEHFSRQIAVIPEKNPTLTDNSLVEWDNLRLVRFYFMKVENCQTLLSDDDIQKEFNMYLQYELLPEQEMIKPFRAGDGYYDKMESLYVHEVKTVGTYLYVDVLFVDSVTAYREVRSTENSKLINYI